MLNVIKISYIGIHYMYLRNHICIYIEISGSKMVDTSPLLCDIRQYADTHSTPVIDKYSWDYLEKILCRQQPKHVLEI